MRKVVVTDIARYGPTEELKKKEIGEQKERNMREVDHHISKT